MFPYGGIFHLGYHYHMMIFDKFLVNESVSVCDSYSYCFRLLKNEIVNKSYDKRNLTKKFDVTRFCCQNSLLNMRVYHVTDYIPLQIVP